MNEFDGAHVSVQLMLSDDEGKHFNWYVPKSNTYLSFFKDVEAWKLNHPERQEVITPFNSVSNASRKSNKSKGSSKSGTSSVSSARIKAEAEKAGVQERAAGLKKKHALELQTIKLQDAIEESELETGIAAANPKVQVLEKSEKQFASSQTKSVSHSKPSEDGMNTYLETEDKERGNYCGSRTSSGICKYTSFRKLHFERIKANSHTQFKHQ